jgi:hypothetical protein
MRAMSRPHVGVRHTGGCLSFIHGSFAENPGKSTGPFQICAVSGTFGCVGTEYAFALLIEPPSKLLPGSSGNSR